MELKMSELVNNPYYVAYLCSGSVAELGDRAGQLTWENSCDQLDEDSDLFAAIVENADEVRDHFREYGAWSDEEIAEWSNVDLVGLVVQDFSAAYRELTEDGSDSGRVYQGDDNEWYMYFGM